MWSTGIEDKNTYCGFCNERFWDGEQTVIVKGKVCHAECARHEQERLHKERNKTKLKWYIENYPSIEGYVFEYLENDCELEELKGEWVVLTEREDSVWVEGFATKEVAEDALGTHLEESGDEDHTRVFHFGKEVNYKTIIVE